ncbi:Conserved_hypothetical protein [Hexamita inflata]|uniref:Uncharacterized protein n=1 Tax=Hexamita inflata TaxID=28002 RepID=A0AA86NXL6_9EUKA|nr:Conserved hypothetical protein [Hexamita inflata]
MNTDFDPTSLFQQADKLDTSVHNKDIQKAETLQDGFDLTSLFKQADQLQTHIDTVQETEQQNLAFDPLSLFQQADQISNNIQIQQAEPAQIAFDPTSLFQQADQITIPIDQPNQNINIQTHEAAFDPTSLFQQADQLQPKDQLPFDPASLFQAAAHIPNEVHESANTFSLFQQDQLKAQNPSQLKENNKQILNEQNEQNEKTTENLQKDLKINDLNFEKTVQNDIQINANEISINQLKQSLLQSALPKSLISKINTYKQRVLISHSSTESSGIQQQQSAQEYITYLLQLLKQNHIQPDPPMNNMLLPIYNKFDMFYVKNENITDFSQEVVSLLKYKANKTNYLKTYSFNVQKFKADCFQTTNRNLFILKMLNMQNIKGIAFYYGDFEKQKEFENEYNCISLYFEPQVFKDQNATDIQNLIMELFKSKDSEEIRITPMRLYQLFVQLGVDDKISSYKRVHALISLQLLENAIAKQFNFIHFVQILLKKLQIEQYKDFTPVIKKFFRRDILPTQNTFVFKIILQLNTKLFLLTDGFYYLKARIENDLIVGDNIIVPLPKFKGFQSETEPQFTEEEFISNYLEINQFTYSKSDKLGLYKNKLIYSEHFLMNEFVAHSSFVVIKIIMGQESAVALIQNRGHIYFIRGYKQNFAVISSLQEGRMVHIIGFKATEYHKNWNQICQYIAVIQMSIPIQNTKQVNICQILQQLILVVVQCFEDSIVCNDEHSIYIIKGETEFKLKPKCGFVKITNCLVKDDVVKGVNIRRVVALKESEILETKSIQQEANEQVKDGLRILGF